MVHACVFRWFSLCGCARVFMWHFSAPDACAFSRALLQCIIGLVILVSEVRALLTLVAAVWPACACAVVTDSIAAGSRATSMD